MKFEIRHYNTYRYSEPVQLNVHELYLIPLQRSHYSIVDRSLKINPTPLGLHERVDPENNPYYQAWFSGETEVLDVEARFEIVTRPFNPFGFILHPASDFPFRFFQYSEEVKPVLSPYLLVEENVEMEAFTRAIMEDSNNIIDFLLKCLDQVYHGWKHLIRLENGIWSSGKTFDLRKGSCRDLSWMMMCMLRHLGLATRFVSGYAFNPELEEGHELHAWLEVFLPGASWVGLDPSLGLFADEAYVPLACSYLPHRTLPIHGNYGGTASSKLHAEVWIKEL